MEKQILPFEKLPVYWQDDSRLDVLFGPFRSRQVNIKDWDTKLDFWKQSIRVYCLHTKNYSFKLSDLLVFFKYNGRSPVCLPQVLEELLKSGELVSKANFMQSASNLSWGMWATNLFIKSPIKWSMNKVRNTLKGPENISDIEFIHLEALKSDSEDLLNNLKEKYKCKVLNFKDLIRKEGIAELQLQYLQTEKRLFIKEVNRNNGDAICLVKFDSKDNSQGITEVDVDIYMLSETALVLKRNLENLEEEMQKLTEEIKKHLKRGHKQLAKTILRKKHDVSKRIETKANALYNVETLQSKLEDSQNDKEVLETYKAALNGLRTTFKEGLNEDSVTTTMLELSESLDIHSDIQSSLSQSLTDENDSELEAELAALMAENENTNDDDNTSSPKVKDLDEEFANLKLPDVPTEEPSIADSKLLDL